MGTYKLNIFLKKKLRELKAISSCFIQKKSNLKSSNKKFNETKIQMTIKSIVERIETLIVIISRTTNIV